MGPAWRSLIVPFLAPALLGAAPARLRVCNDSLKPWTLVFMTDGPEGRLETGPGAGQATVVPVRQKGQRITLMPNREISLAWDREVHPSAQVAFALLDCNQNSLKGETLQASWRPGEEVDLQLLTPLAAGPAAWPVGCWSEGAFHIVKGHHRVPGGRAFPPKLPPAGQTPPTEHKAAGAGPARTGQAKRKAEPRTDGRDPKRPRLGPGPGAGADSAGEPVPDAAPAAPEVDTPPLEIRNQSRFEWDVAASGLDAPIRVAWRLPARPARPQPGDQCLEKAGQTFTLPPGATVLLSPVEPGGTLDLQFEVAARDPFAAEPARGRFQWKPGTRLQAAPENALNCQEEGVSRLVLRNPGTWAGLSPVLRAAPAPAGAAPLRLD